MNGKPKHLLIFVGCAVGVAILQRPLRSAARSLGLGPLELAIAGALVARYA